MKKLLFLLPAFFLLTACQPTNKSDTPQVQSEKVQTAKVGEYCDKNKKCTFSLECKYDAQNFDAGGICVETVVDKDAECPEVRSPVCGKKGRNKNGYLNECEAKRHGAEILHEMFCKKDETVAGSCEAESLGIGNCEKLAIGFEFDGNKCVSANVTGCDAEIPFGSLKECQAKCE